MVGLRERCCSVVDLVGLEADWDHFLVDCSDYQKDSTAQPEDLELLVMVAVRSCLQGLELLRS